MKRTLIVLAVLAMLASAGDMVTGGSELIKFKGYGTFRWNMYGQENANPGNSMSTYTFINWTPKLNEYVDGYISATLTTPGDADIAVDCAYLNLHFAEGFTLAGGQFKKPFGYGYTRSGGSMYFADRTAAVGGSTEFMGYGGRDISAMITAEFAPVTVDLALSNGNGANSAANDTLMKKQFTARLVAEPTEWLAIGGSFAMVGMNDVDSTETDESWSANGMDFFAAAKYPVSPTGTLVFVGEYLMYGAPDTADDATDGSAMSVMAGYDIDLDGDVFLGIMPAVRYDMVTPMDYTGAAENTGLTYIDFCLNIDLFSELNTLQLGMRNYGAEAEGFEGYTDMYAKWRMNF